MKTKVTWLAGIIAVALGLAFAGASLAQTTTTIDVRNFEVISINGNKLVVRDQKGTQQYTVPNDFRFTVDGKKVSVSELKVGMKGTATVTTTTTIKPVVVTEVREVEVLRASDLSVTVRGADGVRRYTRGELEKEGIEVVKDGKPIQIGDLKRGDTLTATIITNGPPIVLTEQQVQADLAESKAEPAATTAGAAPAAPPPASPAPSAAVPPASRPADPSGLAPMWYVLLAVIVAIVLFMVFRRRKDA